MFFLITQKILEISLAKRIYPKKLDPVIHKGDPVRAVGLRWVLECFTYLVCNVYIDTLILVLKT